MLRGPTKIFSSFVKFSKAHKPTSRSFFNRKKMESNSVDTTSQQTQISDATREAILNAAKAIKDADALLFTSGAGMSVDGHYAKSGYPAEKLYECHGCVNYMQCNKKCTDEIWSTTDFKIPEIDLETYRAKGDLPKCKSCESVASPNVLMFYDDRFLPNREEEQAEKFDEFVDSVGEGKLAIIEIGSGQGVPVVRLMGESFVERMANATLIRINWTAEDAKVPKGHISLQMGGLAAINQIDKALSEL